MTPLKWFAGGSERRCGSHVDHKSSIGRYKRIRLN